MRLSRRVEQLGLRAQQRVVATVEDSVLRTEMDNLESEEEDAPIFCVGAHIPALAELALSAWGCRKFQIDTLGDHLCTCTALGCQKG